jgi:hypothetical protein
VGGIRRNESGEVVCENKVAEREVQNGKIVESREAIQRYSFTSRGGVEAKVNIVPHHFVKEHSGALADLRHKVSASRPSSLTLSWSIKY